MNSYSIGIDFGTLSARAVLVNNADGTCLASHECVYPHGILKAMPDGTPLPGDYALQVPEDYSLALKDVIRHVMKKAGVPRESVIGIGLDATSCSVLPVDINGEPLASHPEFVNCPESFLRLWKHHAAQQEADHIYEVLKARAPELLSVYGSHISSEWLFPKLLEVRNKNPQVFAAADRFLDLPDYLTFLLTGNYTASACAAGYKALWQKASGYPGKEILSAFHPDFASLPETKLRAPVVSLGERAGIIRPALAEELGLDPGTAVAVGNVDAHVSVPGSGSAREGALLMIIGTSTCSMLIGRDKTDVSGICGRIEDGILPGLYGYEAGQPCVGDSLGWFVDKCLPAAYSEEAKALGVNEHQLLTMKAEKLRVGESGLIALDWWNGNRSILDNASLSGALIGLTLSTRPEEIYRAMMESTAFGIRTIVSHFEESGLAVEVLSACGGIAGKNPLMMQIYADVLKKDIKVILDPQVPALGSAMFGAVAAGADKGGYNGIEEAMAHMAPKARKVYHPRSEESAAYDRLYRIYRRLHDYFGIENKDIMKTLRSI